MMALSAVLFLGSCQKENVSNDLASGNGSNTSSLKTGDGSQNEANGKVSSASGEATLTVEGRFQHVSFHALKSADGTVSGSLVLHSPGQDVSLKADVYCLTVTGNEAVVGVQVTSSTEGNIWNIEVGSILAFKVVDNGEGSKAAPDQFTDVYGPYPGPRDCDRPFNAPLWDIVGGNIQVK